MILRQILRLPTLKSFLVNSPKCLSTTTNSSKVPPNFLSSIGNHWIWRQNESFGLPVTGTQTKILDLPQKIRWTPLEDPGKLLPIETPAPEGQQDIKQAAKLIVIRRRKMRRHKLRKLRKRMKFAWAKIRQRRELKKEKAFQAVLIAQCKEAEAFSAEKYVKDKLDKLNEVVIPRYWRGRRLPEFLIREKMGLPPKA